MSTDIKPRHSTAVVIFAKPPRVGQVKTRLGKRLGMRAATNVYKGLVKRTAKLCQPFAVDCYFSTPKQLQHALFWRYKNITTTRQPRGSLGEKMFLTQRRFLRHYTNVIIIGCDCAELEKTHFNQAIASLNNDCYFFVPANDGGYTLIASNTAKRRTFHNIQWSSGNVWKQTQNRLKQQKLPYSYTKPISDIDTLSDYKNYRQQRKRL